MSIFEFRFCIANSASITADDIEKIGVAIAITKVREVIAGSCDCGQSHLTIVRSDIGCTCNVDGSLPIFGMFGEYDSLDVVGVQEGVFIDYGKPKRVTCSPHLPEKHQKYLHENYNMANISYYPRHCCQTGLYDDENDVCSFYENIADHPRLEEFVKADVDYMFRNIFGARCANPKVSEKFTEMITAKIGEEAGLSTDLVEEFLHFC